VLLWQNEIAHCAARVAIAGDFLPPAKAPTEVAPAWKQLGSSLASYIGDVDVGVLNLECCIDTAGCTPHLKLGLGDTFTANSEALDFPRALGAQVIGLANNHTHDYGPLGLERTIAAVRNAGLAPIGMTRTVLDSPTVTTVDLPSGQTIGLWAAVCHLPVLATQNKAGIEPADIARGKAALAGLRELGAHINVALLHAGMEHTNYPDPSDVTLMDDLAAAGFDVVAAAHSHRLSGYKLLERPGRGPCFCFYGLGSVCSSVLYSPLEREGLIVIVGVSESGQIAQIDLRFVHLDEHGFGTVPSYSAAALMRDRFTRVSEEIRHGTYRHRFYADVGRDLFHRQFRDMRTAFTRGGINGVARKLTRLRMRHLKRVLHGTFG